MNWTGKLLAVALATVAFLSLDLHAQSTAATEFNLGVDAFKQSAYAEAIQHLERAVSLDPENQDARMYLAKVYAKQYKPRVDTPENVHLAELAIEQYQDVLDSNLNRTESRDSAKGIADLYFQMDKFEDSKKYTQLASDLDPKDPEPYYGIGRIDLKECGSASIPEGRKLGNLPSKNPDQKKACDELHDKNMPFIKEGIDSLDKAIKLRPDYRYAIQLMSQLYLEKAAADCDDPIARTEDLRNWAAWNDKKDFGVSVEARLNSSGDFFEKQLFAGCQSPGAEFSGSGEPYDIAEAYEVYSAIIPLIDPDPKTHMWFIRIDTLSIGKGSSNVGSTGPTGQAREDWKQSHGQTPADTALGDYLKMNTKTWLLQRNFTLPNLYKLVTGDEIKAFSSRGFGEGWIELSAVGFNADRTMAVVYMASHDGKSFLLQKRNGKWEVLGGLSCWVS
jgi:tetratricopeptide (TPR) repeat protein